MGKNAFHSATASQSSGGNLHLIWRLLKKFWRRHPLQAGLMFIMILLVSAMWISEPLYSSYAIDQLMLLKEGKSVNFRMLFGVWAGIFVALSVVQTIEKYLSWQMDNRLLLERREEVYEHVLHVDVAFHTKQKSGEIMKQVDEGADNLVDLQRNLFIDFGPSFLSAFVFLIISFTIHTTLAMILVVSLCLYIGVAMIGTQRTYKLQYGVNRLWVEAIGRAFDAVTNVFAVKSNTQHDFEMGLMHGAHVKAFDMQQKVNIRWAAVEAINFFMLTRILLVSVGILLYVRDAITLGELYFFQFSFFRVLTPFEMLAGLLPQWNKKVGKVRMSQMILDTPIHVKNVMHPKIPSTLKGAIDLKGVCFSYQPVAVIAEEDEERELANAVVRKFTKNPEEELPEPLERSVLDVKTDSRKETQDSELEPDEKKSKTHAGEVLHNINLNILPGEHIAFVGHSGAGKSTLAMLLNRFYDVTKGAIVIDGTDLRELDIHWWRSQIGLVLQENIMFNDSLLNNIKYARPSATFEEVREAASRAAAAEFIESLPEAYETLIGDRGIRLSGGQRQRVAIARAILKQPKIVVLDEATSALDSVTEKMVQEGIRELIHGRTACIIAHRLSTVRSVDRIAVFHKGDLIACAPHQELMKTCDIYREMVELQSHGMLAE